MDEEEIMLRIQNAALGGFVAGMFCAPIAMSIGALIAWICWRA